MSLNPSSKHRTAYHKHILGGKKTKGSLGKVFDIIEDLSDRCGLQNEWENIDGDTQDEIIEKWVKIINKK